MLSGRSRIAARAPTIPGTGVAAISRANALGQARRFLDRRRREHLAEHRRRRRHRRHSRVRAPPPCPGPACPPSHPPPPACSPGPARGPDAATAHELEPTYAPMEKSAEDDVVHAQGVEECREVIGVDAHAVAQVGGVAPTHAPEIGGDPTKPLERGDLVCPDRSIERIPVHEEDRGPFPRTSTARLTPFTITRWTSPGSLRRTSMKDPNSVGTGIGRPSRSTQTNTNSAVAMRVSSLGRRAV